MEASVRGFAEYLTIGEAAEFLRVSPWTLRNWDNSGKLRSARHPVSGYRIYRQEDLEALLRIEGPAVKWNRRLEPPIDWSQIGTGEHFVQFYEDDRYLVDSVSTYVGASILAGEAAIVIATRDHRRRIEKKLERRGLNLTKARNSGQYESLDAEETLSALMVEDEPDATRFDELIGERIRQRSSRWPAVKAFGEMVALLWRRGNRGAVRRLEALWNDLGERQVFTLFCAYPLDAFEGGSDAPAFKEICGCHSRVLPAESYATLSSPAEQLEAIAVLQQKARRMETETAHRLEAERERALLAAIIESSEDAVVSKTLDGIIRSWNAGAQRIFGYSAAEAVGQPITLIIPPDRRQEEHDILARLRRGERIEHFETVRVAQDGRRLDISLTISPLRDSSGRLFGASKIARDITERKLAERRLRESEERHRRLAELLPVGVYTCEAPSGAITYYNEQAAQLWGRAPALGDANERFCGSLRMLLPNGDTLPHDQCPMALAVREGREFRNHEVIVERCDGMRSTVLVNIAPIRDEAGRITGAVNVCHDVSALKRAEQALRDAGRRKDEFLATLAHELRNPLAPIRNGLQLLRMTGEGGAVIDRVREMMERQVAYLVSLVDDLLEISRISRGKIDLKKDRLDLATVISQAVETSKPFIEAAGHRLDLHLPESPVFVEADMTRMAQVFSNLLNNAAKYTPQGGAITLSAKAQDGEVVVSVKDTGIGIPGDMLGRVFEMFTQGENPLRRGQDGLGIGLSLVRTLVQMHSGTVEAFSEGPGRGSEFVIRLAEANGESAGAPKPSVHDSSTPEVRPLRRVLAVDDNKDAADSMGMLLRFLGADVQVAYDGPSAIEAVKKTRPAVVLLDVGMPGMDGCEVARQLRQDPQNKDLLLIALTGWGQESDRRRCHEAGFDHHLVKPVDIEALEALLASGERRSAVA